MNRSITGIAAAAGVLALTSAAYQAAGEWRDSRRFPAPGRLVDIGGRRLHLWCEGEGPPTVVVLPCMGGPGLEWVGVQRALREHGVAVCLVDRAGLGWSDPGPWPRSFDRMVDELAAALDAAQIPGPHVLVGHSTGGVLVRHYAARHRDRVAALVLVDSSHEAQNERLAIPATRYLRSAIRARAKPLTLARAAHAFGFGNRRERAEKECPADLVDAHVALSLTRRRRRADVQEMIAWARVGAGARDANRQLGELPVTMITAGPAGRDDRYDTWLQLQNDLATLSTRTTRIFADHADHHVHHDDPDLVVRVIRDVVRQVAPSN